MTTKKHTGRFDAGWCVDCGQGEAASVHDDTRPVLHGGLIVKDAIGCWEWACPHSGCTAGDAGYVHRSGAKFDRDAHRTTAVAIPGIACRECGGGVRADLLDEGMAGQYADDSFDCGECNSSRWQRRKSEQVASA